eukprot:1161086-Pelagomonas_calceolata.AAC.1
MCANKLVTTRCAIENKNTCHSQVMEPGASNNPPDPHEELLFVVFVVEGIQGSSEDFGCTDIVLRMRLAWRSIGVKIVKLIFEVTSHDLYNLMTVQNVGYKSFAATGSLTEMMSAALSESDRRKFEKIVWLFVRLAENLGSKSKSSRKLLQGCFLRPALRELKMSRELQWSQSSARRHYEGREITPYGQVQNRFDGEKQV